MWHSKTNKSRMKVVMTTLNVVGGCMLQPGFLWIVPTKVVNSYGTNGTTFPVYGDHYGEAIHLLILGMVLVVAAAIMDLIIIRYCDSETTASEMLSPVCQVLAATTLLFGCVLYMPQYANANPPVTIVGMSTTDLAKLLFVAASVVYFADAAAGLLWFEQSRATQIALLLFMVLGVLFIVSSELPVGQSVEAGWLMVAAASLLLLAFVVLWIETLVENCEAKEDSVEDAGEDKGEELAEQEEVKPILSNEAGVQKRNKPVGCCLLQ